MEPSCKARKTSLPARFQNFDLRDSLSDGSDAVDEESADDPAAQTKAGNTNSEHASATSVQPSSKGSGKFSCKTCGRRFDSRLKRTKHQFTHSGASSPLECVECHRTFSSRLALAEHQAWHEDRMLYSCSTCGRQFRQNTGLWRHLRTHNPDARRRRYSCPRCGRDFARRDYLREHLASHEEVQHRRRFVCDICKRAFLQSSDLNRHRGTHAGERRFECGVCKRPFLNAASRKRHEKEHDPAQRVACLECGATFKRACQMREHVVRQHGDSALSKLRAQTRRRIGRNGRLAEVAQTTKSPLGPRKDVLSKTNDCIDGPSGRPESNVDCLLRERLASGVQVALADDLQAGDSRGPERSAEVVSVPVTSSTTRTEVCSDPHQVSDDAGNTAGLVKQAVTELEARREASLLLQDAGGDVCAETQVLDQGDILQRSLGSLPIDCAEAENSGDCTALQSELDFVNRPDFGSQAYYDWLAGFTSMCNLTTLPLDNGTFTKVTQVLKTVSDALAMPSGVLACRENFQVLLGISEDLHRTVTSHLNVVLENLQPL